MLDVRLAALTVLVCIVAVLSSLLLYGVAAGKPRIVEYSARSINYLVRLALVEMSFSLVPPTVPINLGLVEYTAFSTLFALCITPGLC